MRNHLQRSPTFDTEWCPVTPSDPSPGTKPIPAPVARVDVNRREFVSTAAALPLVLAGCTERAPGASGSESTTDDASPTETDEATTANATTDDQSTGAPTTEDCWPQRCEGTALVVVEVARSFSGDVVLEADCREEAVPVDSGESGEIERRERGESCSVRVFVDDETVFEKGIASYQQTTVEVSESSDVQTRTVDF